MNRVFRYALLITLVTVTGCPNWQRAECPTPNRWSCLNDQPHYCSTAKELTPIGDEPCSAQGRVCALNAQNIAGCRERVQP
jgi:hypothetical protein